MVKKKITIFLVIIVFLGIVSAMPAIPPLPDKFSGTVLIDNENAPIGTEIEVFVDGMLETKYNTTQQGIYELHVKSGEVGNIIKFMILSKLAGESIRSGGEEINLNLGIMTSSDTNNGGNSGGSSGGSSSGGSGGGGGGGGGSSGGTSTMCVENWECKSWSFCKPGNIKTCFNWVDKNNCGTLLNKPIDIETCVYEGTETNNQNIEQKKEVDKGGDIAEITGAVVGVGGKVNWIWFVIALVIILILFVLLKFWKGKK